MAHQHDDPSKPSKTNGDAPPANSNAKSSLPGAQDEPLSEKRSWGARALAWIEWAGNKLPDPAMLFVYCILATCLISHGLSYVDFPDDDPSTRIPDKEGKPQEVKKIKIESQLNGRALAAWLKDMVKTFVEFAPLGVVLVALLGVGVADHTGFINACIKAMMSVTPAWLLTPMVLLVSIISHSAGDTGYVLVIPLGGVIFAAAGRHPLAGIVAAFAGVSGGFSANFLPSGLDPMLQGFTQMAAQLVNPSLTVNPLCNWGFTSASTLLIVGAGWYLTDRVIEPKLRSIPVDGNPEDMPKLEPMQPAERRGMWAGLATLVGGLLLIPLASWPESSPLRADAKHFDVDSFVRAAKLLDPQLSEQEWRDRFAAWNTDQKDKGLFLTEVPAGDQETAAAIFKLGNKETERSLVDHDAPLMKGIVPLIFLLFLIPGIVHGCVAGTVKDHRDVIKGMSKSMSTMGYYLVLAFFASQFAYLFGKSKLGALLAIKGAGALQALHMPNQVTIIGIILISTVVNLLIGSASAKWALLGPIFVPMLMELGLSPELTQAAYRIGDSSTNIVTPLMPYFPLIVVYCQRYVKGTGIGTLISLMIPYSITFLIFWMLLLMVYWGLGLPLGLQASYQYIAP